jgi:hypothetical protein
MLPKKARAHLGLSSRWWWLTCMFLVNYQSLWCPVYCWE